MLVLIATANLVLGSAVVDATDCMTRKEQSPPISLGVSGSNLNSLGRRFCCSGTLGSLVQDGDGNQFILSNNHVMATADGSQLVVQPGLADLRCRKFPSNLVADHVHFVPISRGDNVVDAAIAEVVAGNVDSTGTILNIGNIAAGDAVAPRLNLKVQKMGRTSCLTRGKVTGLDATIRVGYPRVCNGTFSGTAIFQHQIQISGRGFSAGGDSGSLVVTTGSCPAAVGLLFAGSRAVTFANPMTTVLNDFGVTMVGNSCSASAILAAAAPTASGSAPSATASAPSLSMSEQVKAAASVKRRHENELMAIPGVVGTGVGLSAHGGLAIKVYVEKNTSRMRAAVPSKLEAVPVEIEETGPITAY